jgi:uncharacterized membrane protein YphA (DoxX/SURF4 family)
MPHQRISPLLDQAWNEYLERFMANYQLTKQQEEQARARLLQAKDQAALWLLGQKEQGDVHETEKSFGSSATVKIRQTSLERLNDYRDKVRQYQQIMSEELPAFGRDVEKQKLGALKADINRARTELLTDLEQPMVDSLATVLTDEQRKLGALPLIETHPAGLDLGNLLSWDGLRSNWKIIEGWDRVQRIDGLTRYGLTLVGACLLLGLFTRTACLGGAAFLLLFYLAMPALPWLPDNPRSEGHYLYINKNIIEMLALLTLASTRSGRWVGLDGLLYCLLPWHWRRRTTPSKETAKAAPPRR